MQGKTLRSRLTGAFSLVLILTCDTPANANPPAQPDKRPQSIIKGADLPEFDLVQGFFQSTFNRYWAGDDQRRDLLKEFNLDEESAAAKALARATLLAKLLELDTVNPIPYLPDPEAFKRVQHDWLRRQVHGTKKVWRQFHREWKQAGQSMDSIDAYIDRKVRPGMVITVVGDPDPEVGVILAEFMEPEEER